MWQPHLKVHIYKCTHLQIQHTSTYIYKCTHLHTSTNVHIYRYNIHLQMYTSTNTTYIYNVHYPNLHQSPWLLSRTWVFIRDRQQFETVWYRFFWAVVYSHVCVPWPKEFCRICFLFPHCHGTLYYVPAGFTSWCDESLNIHSLKPNLFGWPGIQQTLERGSSQSVTQIHHEVNSAGMK